MSRFARFFYIVFSVMLLVGLSTGNVGSVSAQGNGRAILVVYNDSAANKFGRYLGEILRAEGLNSFDMASLGSVSASQLGSYRAVILAETPLTSGQATLFNNYVNGGGYLIAMRPDAQIKSLFGLNTANGTQSDGYLAMPGNGPSQGLSTATLQIHGITDRYSLSSGAVAIAQLYSSATASTAYPAIARSANGRGTAFLYDLARNVVYTRQGNPANANIDRDGDGVLRTIDLFQGSTPWVNLDRVAIPQADIQQRLFARLVRDAVANAHPLPQLWYFPGTAKSVLVVTSDAHANPVAWYQTVVNSMNALNADVTFYLSIGGGLANSQVQTWRGQGHEFGIHPYANRPDTYPPYNITSLSQGYTVYSNWFGLTFSTPKSRTVRNHQVAWRGWTDAADYAVANGMAMDTNFYSWGRWLRKSNGTWARGYINGSGQPMKFMRADGTILPYYQQMTTLVDEQLVSGAGDGGTLENLSVSGAATVSRQLIDASIAGDYAAIMTQFHVDYYAVTRTWAENVVSYAASKSMPLWNADRWLQFTESRYGANYNALNWNGSTRTLSFNLSAPTMSGTTVSTMLPLNYLGGNLESVQVDGAGVSYTTQTISGVNVAFVTTSAGNHSFVADYAGSSGPTATPTTPTAEPTTPTPEPTTATPITPTATPTTPTATPTTPTAEPTTPTPEPTTPPPGGSQTITLQINDANNDVNEVNDTLNASQPAIWIGNGGSTTTSYTGLRFTNVSIPRGATITSAYLQFYSAQSQWILLNLQLSAEAADNSQPFVSNSRPSQRPLTSILNHSSDIGWSANTWYNFNEMASVVQQVVNRSGWQSGNSLSIILKGTGTGTWGRKFVYGLEGAPGFAARLVITYSS
jgi:hypothetical protein